MFKKKIGVILMGLFVACNLQAGNSAKNIINFESEIAKLSAKCVRDNCDSPYTKSLTYHHLDKTQIDVNLKNIFEKISHRQAQVWADTILEGDYVAAGQTRLDMVVNLYRDKELIGYLITYSEKAWNTSDCHYDGITDASLIGCVTGRIIESSYVSLDFKEYFYDEKTAAVFR